MGLYDVLSNLVGLPADLGILGEALLSSMLIILMLAIILFLLEFFLMLYHNF